MSARKPLGRSVGGLRFLTRRFHTSDMGVSFLNPLARVGSANNCQAVLDRLRERVTIPAMPTSSAATAV